MFSPSSAALSRPSTCASTAATAPSRPSTNASRSSRRCANAATVSSAASTRRPMNPAMRYSATIEVGEHKGAPAGSLTDTAWKIVTTRLGDRLRVAGTAELAGWDTALSRTRCEALLRRTFDLFPDAGDRDGVRYWAGLRPATPSNVPLVGGTRYRNLWLDTGHGTLGWTMACGSGKALADLVARRRPDVDFAFLPDKTA